MDIRIREAAHDDVPAVAAILVDAAAWVKELDGTTMWVEGELAGERIAEEVAAGLFFVAEHDGVVCGAVRFQLADDLFWPDIDARDSAFVHRLAVSRAYAGHGVSTAILQWAAQHARSLGKRYLRLDCDADRPRLCALYERFGFTRHSFRHVGAYYVARYELALAGRPTSTVSFDPQA